MSFYKSDRKFQLHWNDIVDKAYLEGLHAQNKGGKLIRTQLPESKGISQENKELFIRTRQQKYDYITLITIESAFVGFVENACETRTDLTRNIWQIMQSQKGTIQYLTCLEKALKKYKSTPDIRKALVADLKMNAERNARNREFLNIWAEECGLSKLVSVIHNTYNQNLFEFTEDVLASDEAPACTSILEEDKEIYFEDRNMFYSKYLTEFAKEHNIDIKTCIQKAHEESIEKRKQINKNKIEKKHILKHNELMKKADLYFTDENQHLFHILETGNNIEPKISMAGYRLLVHNLKRMGGTGYYIAILKSSIVYYLSTDDNLTISFQKVRWFKNKSEAENIAEQYQKNHEMHVAKALEISLPDKFSNEFDESLYANEPESILKSSDQYKVDQQQMVLNLLKKPLVNPVKTMMLEQWFKEHVSMYWIMALKKNKKCHTNPLFCAKITDYQPICNDLLRVQFFAEEADAEKFLKKYKNMDPYNKYDLYINHLNYIDPSILHDRIFPKIMAEKMKVFGELLTYAMKTDQCPDEFTSKYAFTSFIDYLKENKSIRMIVGQAPQFETMLWFCTGSRFIQQKPERENYRCNNIMKRYKNDIEKLLKHLSMKRGIPSHVMSAVTDDIHECGVLIQCFNVLKSNEDKHMMAIIQIKYNDVNDKITCSVIAT